MHIAIAVFSLKFRYKIGVIIAYSDQSRSRVLVPRIPLSFQL